MKQIVGLTSLLASFAVAALTADAVRQAGGFDILSIASVPVVLLLFLGGVSALRSDDR